MSIESTYKEEILEQIIKEILDEGTPLTTTEIESRFAARTGSIDFSLPQFDNSTAKVLELENASVSKNNNTADEIKQDLVIAYREQFNLTDKSVKLFQRWRTESKKIEGELRYLESRVRNLVTTQSDLGASFFIEQYDDTRQSDLPQTTALIDVQEKLVRLYKENAGITKVNLNKIQEENIVFTVLSRNNLIGVESAEKSNVTYAVDDTTKFWQSRVYARDGKLPMTAELNIKISSTPIPISKISIVLHSSNVNSNVQVIPLISGDGINFVNIDSPVSTVSISDKATFLFKPIDATHVKFIFTKIGYDFIADNSFIYEFGAQEITIFKENYVTETQTVFSKPLKLINAKNETIEFNFIEFDACESVPENSSIDYYLSVTNDVLVSGEWIQVEPKTRENRNHPYQLSVGDTDNITIEDVKVSFSPLQSGIYQNPAIDYSVVNFVGGAKIITPQTATSLRYNPINTNDRILNHQLHNDLLTTANSVEIFRNVGDRGSSDMVRDVESGWSFSEPYYTSIIEIQQENGLTIDLGEKNIIIDEQEVNGTQRISKGLHKVLIHKDNWKKVEQGLTYTELETADNLFPFNHKLLIEGYLLEDNRNPYKGVDIYCSHYMKEVPMSDFIYNVESDDLGKFALDRDTADPGNSKLPNTVFVVKSNENLSDFLDERFTVRFDVKNQLYKYIKFRADLSSQDTEITPVLDNWSVKVNS